MKCNTNFIKNRKTVRFLKHNRPTMRAKLNWQYDVHYAAPEVTHWSVDSCWKATSYSIWVENTKVELSVVVSLMTLCCQWSCRYLFQLFELYSPVFIVFDKFYSLDWELNVFVYMHLLCYDYCPIFSVLPFYSLSIVV